MSVQCQHDTCATSRMLFSGSTKIGDRIMEMGHTFVQDEAKQVVLKVAEEEGMAGLLSMGE